MTFVRPERESEDRAVPIISVGLCLVFGLVHILNVHPTGDGMWFWYGQALRSGDRLYSELHFPLQPLFVLLTACFQSCFGTTWLASKILPVLQLVAYCSLLACIVRRADMSKVSKGWVYAGVFFTNMASTYYRFDDYHITSDVLTLCVVLLLLRCSYGSRRGSLISAFGVGFCCGLCASNRINDGLILLFSSMLVFALRSRQLSLLTLPACVTGASLAMLAVLSAVHERITAWWSSSVVEAAATKGGSGSIFLGPVILPWHLLTNLAVKRSLGLMLYALVLTLAWRLVVLRARRGPMLIGSAVLATLVCIAGFVWQSRNNTPAPLLGFALALFLYGAGIAIVVLALRRVFRDQQPGPEILLVIPFFQLLAASLTSAKTLPDVFPSVSGALLLAPIVLQRTHRMKFMPVLVGVCMALCCSISVAKTLHPYSWHHYRDGRLFADRVWFDHPLYGPMYIAKPQLAFFESSCKSILHEGEPASMLSLPYPYMNYFCGVPPWHGFIQTWYDTSSRYSVLKLSTDLRQAPPEWIIYQHDLNVVRIHEKAFHGGRALPQRDLDRLIRDQLSSHRWSVVSRTCFDDSDWLLIRTRPERADDQSQAPVETTWHGYCEKDYDDL